MVKPVDHLIGEFASAGASYITFHPEASEHVDRSLELIRSRGVKCGLVLNPATSIHCLDHVLDKLDMILIMSINPGFGGQTFIDTTHHKLKLVRDLIDQSGRDIRLEVDGGVKIENIAAIADSGADTFVAGSAVFGSSNYRETLDKMRQQLGFDGFPCQ
jgi:ribulose-phosphate 3-epimerase